MSPELLNAIAALLWPLMALAAVLFLAPVLRERFRQGGITIKVGEFELTAQEATDQLRKQVEDLQVKLAALGAEGGKAAAIAPPPGDRVDGPSASDAEGGVAPAPPGASHGAAPIAGSEDRSGIQILWVDNTPENNALIAAALRDKGHSVVIARDTAAALERLRGGSIDLVISDMGRPEGRTAGLDLLRAVRDGGSGVPFAFFTSAASARRHRDAIARLGGLGATASTVDLVEMINQVPSKAS